MVSVDGGMFGSGAHESDAGSRPSNGVIRVCLVGPSRHILGGQAVQLERLMNRLREIPALEVGFIAVNPQLPGFFGRVQRVKYLRTIVTSLKYFATLRRELRDYDVVHAFSASYWSFLLAPFPAMLVGHRLRKAVV